MYCSHPTCRKEVDINSVLKHPDKKSPELFNVCKSCGKTEFLYSSKEEFDKITKDIGEQRIKNQKYLDLRYNNPTRFAVILASSITIPLVFGTTLLFILGGDSLKETFNAFLYASILFFFIVWLPVFFHTLVKNKAFLQEEKRIRYQDYKSKSKQ